MAKLLTRDKARRIVSNIAKLPELLRKPWRAAQPQAANPNRYPLRSATKPLAKKHARYESIHKAVQYKNSGAIQSGIMNERDVITMGLKEDFQCWRKAAEADARQTSLSIQKKMRPLHEGIVKIPQRASGFDGPVKFTKFDRGKISFCVHKLNRIMSFRQV